MAFPRGVIPLHVRLKEKVAPETRDHVSRYCSKRDRQWTGIVMFRAVDALGYLGSGLVLLAFCMRSMVPLRTVALCSNVAFLAYGFALGLAPVLALHAALLPINAWRLWQAARPSTCRPLLVSSK
jgi:hypothetical protein